MLALCSLALSAAALAAPAELATQFQFWVDRSGQAKVADIRAGLHDQGFEPATQPAPSFGVPQGPIWARGQIDHAACPCVLRLGFAVTDRIDVWVDSAAGQTHHRLGDQRAGALRDLRHPLPVIPLAAGPQELLIRIASESPVSLPLQLWPERAFWEASARSQLFYGSYYGVLIALLVYNLFLFGAVRDRGYLYYCGWLASFTLFQAGWHGHLQAWLWPAQHALPANLTIFALYLAIAAGCLFARQIANSAQLAPRMHRLLLGLSLVSASLAMISCFSFQSAIGIAPVVGAIAVGGIVHTLIISALAGYRPAAFTLIGFLMIAPGGIALALVTAGLIQANWFTGHAITVGSALDALLLSFALADRINLLNQDRARLQRDLLSAERQSLAAQQRYSKDLLAAQDAERARLARELHDGVAQQLAAIAGRLRRLAGKAAATPPEGLAPTAALAGDAVNDLRAISRGLHPQQLERLGLSKAIASDAEWLLRDAGIAVNVNAEPDFDTAPLSPHARLQLYRVAQEAMHNVGRHARASSVSIALRLEGRTAVMEIADTGIGMQPQDSAGLGLRSMRERIASTEGSISFSSEPGKGLHIRARAPLTT